MTMKRRVSAILALVMLLSLCACGGIPDTPASTEPPQTAEPEETPAPESPDPAELIAQADAWIAAGETEENLNAALELYQAVLDIDPENIDAIMGTVDVMIRKGNYENALKWLKTFTLTMPGNTVISEKIREIESGNIKDREGKSRLDSGFYPDGRPMWTFSYAYNAEGKVCEVVLRDGEGKELDRAEIVYDDHGYAVKTYFKIKDQDNMLSIGKKNFTNTYDDHGNLIVQEDDEGRRWENTFDENDHMTRQICYMNGKLLSDKINEYNELGQWVYEEYHQSGTLRWIDTREYNEDGNITKYDRWNRSAGSLHEHETRFFEYENGVRVRCVQYNDDELYRTTEYEYDADGNLTAEYIYDADGNLIETDFG